MADRYQAELLEIRDKYREAGEEWPATAKQIAAWAVAHKLFTLPVEHTIQYCARQMSQAMRREEFMTPAGEKIRRMIAFPEHVENGDGTTSQQWLWDDVRTASHEHRIAAFRVRHRAVRADARKLQHEIHVVNAEFLREGEDPIHFDFNFDGMQDDEG